jgi:cytochrome c-type biogenesis protein CcmH/NrfG
MRKDSVIFGIAGVFFGLLVGWIIGSQQAGTGTRVTQAPGPAQAGARNERPAPPLDERRVAELTAAVQKNASDAESRVQLANLYFDAERFDDAIKWYEDALKVDPRNPNASTDLGIAYYYTNQVDRALSQFDRSLAIDPRHTKTLLNQGFVLAFGKQDLDGAAKSWQQVVDIAPDSAEGQRARQSLEALRTAHPGGGTPAQPPPGKSSGGQGTQD